MSSKRFGKKVVLVPTTPELCEKSLAKLERVSGVLAKKFQITDPSILAANQHRHAAARIGKRLNKPYHFNDRFMDPDFICEVVTNQVWDSELEIKPQMIFVVHRQKVLDIIDSILIQRYRRVLVLPKVQDHEALVVDLSIFSIAAHKPLIHRVA